MYIYSFLIKFSINDKENVKIKKTNSSFQKVDFSEI